MRQLLILLVISSPSITSTPVPSTATPPNLSHRPIVLVVSFDGFAHSYLSPTHTPILNYLSFTGSTVPYLQSCFPTKTFPNHHSIATGLFTDVHGVVDNTLFDSVYNATLSGRGNDTRFWNYDPNVLPIYIRNELQGGISGCLFWPGSNIGYGVNKTLFPTYYMPQYNQSLSWETRVETVISWMTDKEKPANLVFLYHDQPDTAGHLYGPNGQGTLDQIVETDKRAGYLMQQLKLAGIFEKVNLIILSDHGFAEVTSERVIDLNKFVDTDKLVGQVNGATPVIQVVPKNGVNDDLYSVLKNGSEARNFTALKKKDICADPYFFCKSRRIIDFVTVADVGWDFAPFNVSMASTKDGGQVREADKNITVYGNHGYINTAVQMQAIFIAKGPAFKTGYVTEHPIKNVDIVPLIKKIIGLVNVPANGTWARVEGMIRGAVL